MDPNYKNIADNYRELPSDDAWSRIEGKLQAETSLTAKTSKKTILFTAVSSIAAIAILLVLFFPYQESNAPAHFVTNSDYNPTRLEALIDTDGRVYTAEMVDQMYAMYTTSVSKKTRKY